MILPSEEDIMRFRATTLLLVSFLCCMRAFGQNPDDLKNKAIAFLDLSTVANRVRSAGAKAQNPTRIQNSSSTPTRQQYLSLYQALTKLQSTRAGYLTNLKLYVDSVKGNLPLAHRRERLTALEDQVVLLRQGLIVLANAMDPLQISLDINAPSLSDLISDYTLSNQAKVASTTPGLLETLTLVDLQTLQSQAINNGKTLHQAIEGLRAFIKQQYPDIG
jgi:hypothetical protein